MKFRSLSERDEDRLFFKLVYDGGDPSLALVDNNGEFVSLICEIRDNGNGHYVYINPHDCVDKMRRAMIYKEHSDDDKELGVFLKEDERPCSVPMIAVKMCTEKGDEICSLFSYDPERKCLVFPEEDEVRRLFRGRGLDASDYLRFKNGTIMVA